MRLFKSDSVSFKKVLFKLLNCYLTLVSKGTKSSETLSDVFHTKNNDKELEDDNYEGDGKTSPRVWEIESHVSLQLFTTLN